MKPVLAYLQQIAAAIRAAFIDRLTFWLNLGGMVLNNGFVLLLWFLFFAGFRQIGGWHGADVALLYGITATTVGLAGVLAGGYRDLAAAILRGDLDALLTQPAAPLPRMLGRESAAHSWGDVGTGLILLATLGGLGLRDLPALILALGGSLLVFLASGVLFASLAFWLSGARSLARDLTDFVTMFSSYPGSIYRGMTEAIVYSLIPAGFVVLVPVTVVRHPGLATIATLGGGALTYGGLALVAFHLGLRRYRHGSVPVSRL